MLIINGVDVLPLAQVDTFYILNTLSHIEFKRLIKGFEGKSQGFLSAFYMFIWWYEWQYILSYISCVVLCVLINLGQKKERK